MRWRRTSPPDDPAAGAGLWRHPRSGRLRPGGPQQEGERATRTHSRSPAHGARSEEHTSELQSHSDLVCRLLLEKKKKKRKYIVKKKKKKKKKKTKKKKKKKQ